MNILYISSSPGGESSYSRKLARSLIDRLRGPSASVRERDLALNPPPHWDAARVSAAATPAASRRPASEALLSLSNELCQELQRAQILVIAAPMWNFSVPSTLKAWIDHVVRAGVTFEYSAAGPRGLLQNLECVYIVEATGGNYLQPPALLMNHVGPYLTHVFKFLGAARVETVSIPGTAISPSEGLSAGESTLQQILK